MISIAAVFALVILTSSGTSERVDLYDTKGRRTGYATIDRERGRVDYYDTNSRRTGYGQLAPDGRVDRFDLNGRRQEPHAVPPSQPRR